MSVVAGAVGGVVVVGVAESGGVVICAEPESVEVGGVVAAALVASEAEAVCVTVAGVLVAGVATTADALEVSAEGEVVPIEASVLAVIDAEDVAEVVENDVMEPES